MEGPEDRIQQTGDLDEIEVIGEAPKDLVTPFKPHRSFNKRRVWRLEG